ncbi:MAG: type II toxin-antitoxin system VapC family toxin [Alphaproteobacteria bacterium]|nr:type II toxin-antitoxin system VapC family toxin [Alphaproteobacteria bacterium]
MTDAVVDANVALKWVLPEADSDVAAGLRGLVLSAPEFWLVECGNVLWVQVHRRKLTLADAAAMLDQLRAAPVRTHPCDGIIAASLAIAADLDESLYDCIYLALAISLGARLVTADMAFARKAQRRRDLADRVVGLSTLR